MFVQHGASPVTRVASKRTGALTVFGISAAIMATMLPPLSSHCAALAVESAVTPPTPARNTSAQTVPPRTGTATPETPSDFRLPPTLRPVRYHLTIEPDFIAHTFFGTEKIEINAEAQAAQILLNSLNLAIQGATLSTPDKTLNEVKLTVTPQPRLERISLALPDNAPLGPGKYELSIKFKGKLEGNLRGLYLSSFKDAEGKIQYLASTQMEPTDARRMFPCFDEPNFKARYKIKTLIPTSMVALSNAPQISTLTSGERKEIAFAESAPMPSYLVALIVGPFESSEPVTVENVPIRVWSVKGKKHMAGYASAIAAKMLPYFSNYFGTPYPERKLDLIAIPDFEAGAMENLGAITFREDALLVDESSASVGSRVNVASIIAHEMAHMWFGDLVTMKWWDDLWLNEAFATWMSVKAVDFAKPEWHSWDSFAVDRVYSMDIDALASSRPIQAGVTNPAQALEMFDGITYEKGASILRMLEMFIGEKVFQAGVQKYMKAHSYANADTSDLWKALSESARQDIAAMMSSWVNQAGYPLVKAVWQGTSLLLDQHRFLYDAAQRNRFDEYLWQIPIVPKQLPPPEKGKAPDTLLLTEQQEPLEVSGQPRFLLLNREGNGYFRSQYPTGMLKNLMPETIEKMQVSERVSLLSDQWALTFAGLAPIDEYLAMTALFKNETDPYVMDLLVSQLHELSGLIDDDSRIDFAVLVRDRLAAAKKRLGWQGSADETDLVRFMRENVLGAIGTIGGDRQTISEAKKLFTQYMDNPTKVDPNLVTPMTRIIAYNGSENDYECIKNLWKTAKTPEIEKRNLMALAQFRDASLIDRTMELSLSEEVRLQDSPNLLGRVLSTESGRSPAWRFIKANWKTISTRYPEGMLPHLVSHTSSLAGEDDESDLRAFFRDHPVKAGSKKIAQATEKVHNNAMFRLRSNAALKKALINLSVPSTD